MNRVSAVPRDIALTFAGGGNRTFYQLGLLHQWGDRLRPRIAAVAACSAGAFVATVWLTGRETQTHRFWLARRQGVVRNFQWSRLLRGQRPTPHGPIYRDTLLCAFAEGGLQNIQAAPFPILIVTARPPAGMPKGASALLGLVAYNVEQTIRRPFIHPFFGRSLGFTPYVIDARRCQTSEELTDLIIASSATPPFTPVGQFDGLSLLDGGLIDNVPASAAERIAGVKRNLVMLARAYPASCVGVRGQRLYVAPTVTPPISVWDYTRPEKLEETIAMGEAEATNVHGPAFRRFLVW